MNLYCGTFAIICRNVLNIGVYKSFTDSGVRAVDFQSREAAWITEDVHEPALKSYKMKMKDGSYLACSWALALVPHTIERDPGIQSRL